MDEKNDSLFSDEEFEYLRANPIYVATPAYGEQVSAYYARSLARLFALATAHNLPVTYTMIGNESLVTRARNVLVGGFLESNATHMLFIDADISFEPVDVFRLALHRRHLVAGAYPVKGLSWDRAVKKKTGQEVKDSVINYVINLPSDVTDKTKTNGMLDVQLHDGLLEVLDAGTGFMMISRYVFEKLIEAYGSEISYVTDTSTIENDGTLVKAKKKQYAFLDTYIELETERYLSEDYTFCRRWQSLEGKVWVDPQIILNHHGTYTYRGYPIC